jgi:hypothetical protein
MIDFACGADIQGRRDPLRNGALSKFIDKSRIVSGYLNRGGKN